MKYAPTRIRMANIIAITPTTCNASPARTLRRSSSENNTKASPRKIRTMPCAKIINAATSDNAKPMVALLGGVGTGGCMVFCCCKIPFSS